MGTAQLLFVEDPCGGSRGSDHCTCLTGSDVTGSHVTFFPYFPVLVFPYFPPRTSFPYSFFFTYLFPRIFPPTFFSRTIFFPYFFFPYFFLPYYFFPVFFFPYIFLSYYFFPVFFFFRSFFPVLFSSIFFLVVVQKIWLGVFSTTSASYNHRKLPLPFYFHILGVLYDVRVL